MSQPRLLRPYRILTGVPHAPGLMAFSLLGRLQMPAVPMVLTFLVAEWTGSYASAGVVVGAVTVGQAAAGPVRGRAADRRSVPLLLTVLGALYAAGLVAIVLVAAAVPAQHWWAVIPLAGVTGMALPPVGQVGKAIWPRIAWGTALEAAYAVEATLQELIYVVAPVFAAFAVTHLGADVGTLAVAAVSVLGPASFALALRHAGLQRAPARAAGEAGEGRSLLRTPGMLRLPAFGAALIAGLVAGDLLLVGWSQERGTPQLAGVLAAVWALGSLTGGLLAGGLPGRPVLWRRGIAAAVGLAVLVPALPPVTAGSPLVVAVLLGLGGMAIAPSLAAANSAVAEIAPPERRNEAFGWFFSATTAGAAVASPLSGAMMDLVGPAAAAGAAALLVAGGVALVAHHSLHGSRSTRAAEETART
ncbi:MFS transporter [Salinifilum aidingensis]